MVSCEASNKGWPRASKHQKGTGINPRCRHLVLSPLKKQQHANKNKFSLQAAKRRTRYRIFSCFRVPSSVRNRCIGLLMRCLPLPCLTCMYVCVYVPFSVSRRRCWLAGPWCLARTTRLDASLFQGNMAWPTRLAAYCSTDTPLVTYCTLHHGAVILFSVRPEEFQEE